MDLGFGFAVDTGFGKDFGFAVDTGFDKDYYY